MIALYALGTTILFSAAFAVVAPIVAPGLVQGALYIWDHL